MENKRFYNDRYKCPDPLARTAVSRSTRHRILKKRRLDEIDSADVTVDVDETVAPSDSMGEEGLAGV